MKKNEINGLHSLNSEIDRLKIEAGYMESKLDEQFDTLKGSFGSLLLNSFCKHRKQEKQHAHENGSQGFFSKDSKLNAFFNKISDRLSDRFDDEIDSFLDKVFHKHK
jgi:hypothetical protein